MHTLYARNVNDAIQAGIYHLLMSGVEEDSRNGKVLVAPTPVTTVYHNPRQRVLFSPTRDANPFFHFMESLWMLAGRRDVRWIQYFNGNIHKYSDDGQVFHGAYGHRWRSWFGFDQLASLAQELRRDPNTRRAVLTMWDASEDIFMGATGGKDVPCNTQAYLDCRGGELNMTVCCRSNDAIWGAYGANAVQFSVLLEVLAAWVGVPVGVYRQMSNNLHVYTELFTRDKLHTIAREGKTHDEYSNHDHVSSFPIVNTPIDSWFQDLETFMHDTTPHDGVREYGDEFFSHVAEPMYTAYQERKERRGNGLQHVAKIDAGDWRTACHEWVHRRESAKEDATAVPYTPEGRPA